jgi:plastocyanin
MDANGAGSPLRRGAGTGPRWGRAGQAPSSRSRSPWRSSFQAETHVVFALGYKFEPAEVRIKPGDTVRWENREKVQYHSVYFAALNDPVQDYFFPGESRERTFDKAGTYDYICEPHWESHRMGGRVLVGE